jgi:uncharacterized membrane protein
MGNPIIQVVMRYLHIVSAVVAVGGMAFWSLCVVPAAKRLDESTRGPFLKSVQERFLKVVLVAIAGLIISGTYNWVMLAGEYRKMGWQGNALIGTKVLLATVIFCIVFARSIGLIKPTRFWHMFNLHLAAVVILLAATLRYCRLEFLHSLIPGP